MRATRQDDHQRSEKKEKLVVQEEWKEMTERPDCGPSAADSVWVVVFLGLGPQQQEYQRVLQLRSQCFQVQEEEVCERHCRKKLSSSLAWNRGKEVALVVVLNCFCLLGCWPL